MKEITLRPVRMEDVEFFFEIERDEEAMFMVAFSSNKRENLEEYRAHWLKRMENKDNILRTIIYEKSHSCT